MTKNPTPIEVIRAGKPGAWRCTVNETTGARLESNARRRSRMPGSPRFQFSRQAALRPGCPWTTGPLKVYGKICRRYGDAAENNRIPACLLTDERRMLRLWGMDADGSHVVEELRINGNFCICLRFFCDGSSPPLGDQPAAR